MRTRTPLAARFWPKVQKGALDECWLWTAALNQQGYGILNEGGRGSGRLAHRVSWQLHNGEIPSNLEIMHKCDVPRCVNPSHLTLGTHAQNMADMKEKGRHTPVSFPGETHPMAKLTDAIVRNIRSTYSSGGITQRDLAKKFDISFSSAQKIIQRRRWRHIGEDQ